MDLLRKLPQRTKLFIASAYTTPHWILATVFFVSATTFIGTYRGANPEEWALLEHSNNELELQARDNDRICSLRGTLLVGVRDSENLMKRLASFTLLLLKDFRESGTTSRGNEITELHEQTLSTLDGLKTLKANVKGSQFLTPAYNDEARLNEEFLDNSIKMFEKLEGYCHAYMSGSGQEFAKQFKQLGESTTTLNQELKTLLARSENVNIQCESARKANLIEQEKLYQQKLNYRIKSAGYYIAIVFCTLYLVVAVPLGIARSSNFKKASFRSEKRITKPRRRRRNRTK